MKYTFIASVAILCFVMGFRKANELTKKRYETEQIIDFLTEIKQQIKYCKSTLKNIITDYCSTEKSPFTNKLSVYIKEYDFPVAWKKAFEESNSYLDKNEKRLFLSFADKLGTSDVSSQENLIDYALSHFKKELEKAEKNENEKKRLYIITGVASGFALAILMI